MTIVLDFNPRIKNDQSSSSGCIAWIELLKIHGTGELLHTRRYCKFISGYDDSNNSEQMLIQMNKCINLPNRLCTLWRARIASRLLEM